MGIQNSMLHPKIGIEIWIVVAGYIDFSNDAITSNRFIELMSMAAVLVSH